MDPLYLSEGKAETYPELAAQKAKEGYKYTKGKVGEGYGYVAETVGEGARKAQRYAIVKGFQWSVYIILIIQIIIEIFSTTSEVLGIKTAFGTRIVVMVLAIVQIVWASGGIYLGQSNMPVGRWLGITYFGVVLAGAIISGSIQLSKMQTKPEESSKAMNIIGLVAKGLQAIASVVFGIIFFIQRVSGGYGILKMYSMLIVGSMELIT